MRIKITSFLTGLMLLLTFFSEIPTLNVFASSNPYPVNGIGGSTGEYSNCTWAVWQLVYEDLGIALPAWGDAYEWYDNAASDGYQVGSTPMANSIIVYKNGGHVAFVTEVISNDRIYIKEGGYGTVPNLGYHEGETNAAGYREYTGQEIIGYIYLDTPWYTGMTPVDRGEEIYAALIKNDGWVNIGNVNGDVRLNDSLENGMDAWRLVRQSDGSYVIYSCVYNDPPLCLDGYDGENVNLWEYYGGACQRWYIYGPWSGEYILRHQGTDKVLTVPDNSNEFGTDIILSEYSNSPAQQMALWTLEKAGSSTLSVSADDSASLTEFSWTEAENATHYSIRIKNGSPGNVTAYKDVWEYTDTSYSILLPAGYYEVYIDCCNRYSYSGSNIVSFTVEQSESVLADINQDSQTTVLDLILFQQYLLAQITFTESQFIAADLNSDSNTDAFDLCIMKRMLIQK